MPQAEIQGRKTAHRETNDVRAPLTNVIENGQNVIGGTDLRIGRDLLWHLRGREAARIECNAPVAFTEMAHLRLEATAVAGKFMDEDEGMAGSGFLEIEAHTVVRGRVRHVELRLGAFIKSRRSRECHRGAAARQGQIPNRDRPAFWQ